MAGGSAGINVTAFSAFVEPDGEEVAPPCREPHPTTSRPITKLRKQDMIVRFIVCQKLHLQHLCLLITNIQKRVLNIIR
jgi:hypothetical protein